MTQRNIPIGFDQNESLIEELEYDLMEAHELGESDCAKILQVFTLFQNDIPNDDQEAFEGFDYVKVRESETFEEERGLLFSNYALYILRKQDLNYIYRRIRLENIQILLLESNIDSMILHMVSSELLGDLWVLSNRIEDIHNCIQTMFKYITRRYIPISILSDKHFKTKFNNFPQSFVHSLINDENLKANDVVIQEGKIGECILYNKKSRSILDGKLIDCVCILTTKALYCLNNSYEFIHRLEIKLIKAIRVTENMDKLVIEQTNGNEHLWFLNSKFITELEKAMGCIRKERLNIINKDIINVEDFLNEKPKKIKRT